MKPLLLPAVLLVLPLAACVSTPTHRALAEPAPVFSPQAFFAGRTIGKGTLKIDISGSKPTNVVGDGHVEPDGTLVLVQRVAEGTKPVRTRTWHIRPAGEGHFSGTLSDAKGPISADVRGNRLHIRFTAKGGLDIEQWLYLQPGGQVAVNRMVVRKFGIPVASLDETITKQN